MEDGWSSFVCREHHFCSVLEEGSSRKLESWISVCHSTMTVTANKVNLISKWFVLIVCSCLVENCVSISFGIGASLSFDAMPGDLDLYVYLNIEMAIVLLQLIFFLVLPSRYSKFIECSDCRQHVRWVLPFCSLESNWVVKFPAARLWAVCNLYTALWLFTNVCKSCFLIMILY